ncbi:MAG: YbaK/EbsC family protein [Pseudomonadota bacterium]
MPGTIHTADEATPACGCPLGVIAKSLILRTEAGPHLPSLVSGANRVHAKRLGQTLERGVSRAETDRVRQVTGFAIGGTSPLGHASPVRVVKDRDLPSVAKIRAAASTPRSVCPIAPNVLARLAGAEIQTVT